MMPVAIYGWKCLRKDKDVLLRRINDYLAGYRQKTTETATRKMFV